MCDHGIIHYRRTFKYVSGKSPSAQRPFVKKLRSAISVMIHDQEDASSSTGCKKRTLSASSNGLEGYVVLPGAAHVKSSPDHEAPHCIPVGVAASRSARLVM